MHQNLIAEIKSVNNFSVEDIELFINHLDEFFVAKGEHFLQDGQISHYVAYVKSGLTMHYRIHDGVEIPVDFTIEDQWLGYLKSFSTRTPSDMNIKALEDTWLLRLSAENMEKVFQLQPKFMALKSYYTELSFISNTQHSANLAMLTAKQRYYKFMEEKPELVNRVPQYYIAAYLGIKPQSLSRIRK